MSGPSAVEQLGRRLLVAGGYRSEWIPTSVGRIHVWRSAGGGSLPPVLLFHGFGSSALHWSPLLLHLRPRVRGILAFDLPAHGFSDRPATLTHEVLTNGILEAMDRAHVEPSVVIGNSLGGAAAVRYLNARPDKVLGAVLFSPAGAPMDQDELAALQAVLRVDDHADAVRFLRDLHARPIGLRAHLLAPMIRRTLSDPILRGWLDRVSLDDFLTAEEVASVPRPMRIVWGRQERILPFGAREFWRAHLPPHSEVREPDGFGHSPFLDDRRWTANEITSFAEQLGG